MPAVVVMAFLAPVPSVSVTLCGTRSSSASPASGIAVLGEVDIWIGWACTPSPASAWPTVGAVVQTSRCDGPSSRISLRARLKMTWSPLSIAVGRAGSTRSCGAASMPAACSAEATSAANVCTVAVLAVDGHGDRLVHGHRRRPAADEGEEEGERGGADGRCGPTAGRLALAAFGAAGVGRRRGNGGERLGDRLVGDGAGEVVVEVGADGGDGRGDRPGVGDGDASGLRAPTVRGRTAARPRRRHRGRPGPAPPTRERPGPDPRRPGSTRNP